ncbi:hypothetical protein EZS27_030544 [termite gut metagenome]|uniref:Carbohydrate-binding domain-containing protein n=1 Tax=termite gut metagenome TaxID=433724 RepID=A0A5J4QG82_9ZZZZ
MKVRGNIQVTNYGVYVQPFYLYFLRFFNSANGLVNYYDIESNCIGKILIATGVNRYNCVLVPAAIIHCIDHWSRIVFGYSYWRLFSK